MKPSPAEIEKYTPHIDRKVFLMDLADRDFSVLRADPEGAIRAAAAVAELNAGRSLSPPDDPNTREDYFSRCETTTRLEPTDLTE